MASRLVALLVCIGINLQLLALKELFGEVLTALFAGLVVRCASGHLFELGIRMCSTSGFDF